MPQTEKQRAYQKAYYEKHREKRNAESKARAATQKQEKRIYDKERRVLKGDELRAYDSLRSKDLQRRVLQIWLRAKNRARVKQLAFSIDKSDIYVPEVCPVLGVRLDFGDKQGGGPFSPSLDRLDPKKGYVKGNVHIISKRANAIKSDATLSEVLAVARWMEARLSEDQLA